MLWMLPQEDGAQFLIALQLWWPARMTRKRRAGYAPKRCFDIPLNIERKLAIMVLFCYSACICICMYI
ncbi:hypothetical protein NC651_018968 [Populus alba x Populus x berolinensis]|nr:hypothetical protein NC651_018968 [Populus alba x Populus x berolinensis]